MKRKTTEIGDAKRECDGCKEPDGVCRWFEIDSVKGLCWRCCNLPKEQRPKELAGRMGR